jgi:molybdate transport system permease protein
MCSSPAGSVGTVTALIPERSSLADTTIPKPVVSLTIPSRRLRINGWQVLAFPLIAFVTIPILALFLQLSLEDLFSSLQSTEARTAIRLSAATSLMTVVITLLFGTPLSYLIYRRRSRLSSILDTLIDLPTVMPPAVAGVALLMAFGRNGVLGQVFNQLGLQIPFTSAAVVMAQTFIAAPLYIKSAALGFAGVDCELKKSAALDGANRWQVFRYITVPMTWPSLLTGAILTWARALGEFGATIIFAGNLPGRTQTMPLAIYLGFELDLKVALTLSAILILFSFIVLIAVKTLLAEKIDPSSAVAYD